MGRIHSADQYAARIIIQKIQMLAPSVPVSVSGSCPGYRGRSLFVRNMESALTRTHQKSDSDSRIGRSRDQRGI